MKITKQAKREAKQLYRLCLVNGLLDENRVRQVVQASSRPVNGIVRPSSRIFCGW